jgi:hypothetical protein
MAPKDVISGESGCQGSKRRALEEAGKSKPLAKLLFNEE